MIEKMILMMLMCIFHWADGLYTIAILNKDKKNKMFIEINYHKWFFKKFGLVYGLAISMSISTFIFLFGYYLIDELKYLYFLTGMVLVPAIMNFRIYYDYGRLEKLKGEIKDEIKQTA